MRLIINCCVVFGCYFISSNHCWADIHRWTDEHGRIHFSDSASSEYSSSVISSSSKRITAIPVKPQSNEKERLKSLNKTAAKMKKQRLKREKSAQKKAAEKRKKRLKHEKRLAKIEKKKQACAKARKREDIAFRQRIKSQRLSGMRKSLENYDKKRAIRQKKCK